MALRALQGPTGGGTPVGGTGTTNTIPRWTGPSTLGDSGLIDDGSVIYTTARNAAFGSTSSAGYRARVLAAAGAGSAFGLRIDAGTNSTDYALRIANQATTSDYLAVRGDGNVGIGTASPLARLHSFISGAAPLVAAGGDPISGSVVEGPNTALASGSGSLQPLAVLTNDTQAVDRGGGILFGGKWSNAANSFAYFGGVKAGKENSTSAEYGGYLAFYSRTNGATGLAERARIDSSGRLLVGTSTAPGSAAVRSVLASNSGVYAGIQNTGTNVGCAFGVGAAIFELYTSSGVYGVETYTQRMAVSSAGTQAQSQVAIGASSFTSGCSLTVAQSIDASQSGQGLKLQGTAGTNNTDPNVLDFYADGGTANSGGVTWTPAITFGGASTGITYQTQVGRYTRVGNMVFATCYVVLTSKGTATGNVKITGLPTSSNTTSLFTGATVGYFANITSTGQVMGYMSPNDTGIILNQTTAAGANTALTDANFANNSAIIVTIAYPVT